MAPKNNKNDSKGLSYVAATPSFLKNFGQPQAAPSRPGEPSGGRAALPERPGDGRWAGGSDGEEEEDEWEAKFGGGGDEGPQVVVLKEGRHLTAEEVTRERNRAAGKKSQSPPPSKSSAMPKGSSAASPSEPSKAKSTKPIIPKPNTSKRKLVGAAAGEEDPEEGDKKGAKGLPSGKKRKKGKGMLSFNEAEGEE